MAGFFSSLFLCQKLVYLIHSVAVYIRPLLCLFSTNRFRLEKEGSGCLLLNEIDKKTIFLEAEFEEKDNATEFRDCDERPFEEDEEKEELFLKFSFPTYEEFRKVEKGTGNNNNNNNRNTFITELVPSTKFEFTSGKTFISAFIDELESYPVKEEINDADGISNFPKFNDDGVSSTNLDGEFSQTDGVHEEAQEILVFDVDEIEAKMEFTEKKDEFIDECQFPSGKKSALADSDSVSTGFDEAKEILVFDVDENEAKMEFTEKKDEFINECQFSSGKKSVTADSDSESTGFGMDPHGDGFLSDGDFETGLNIDSETESTESELSDLNENQDSSDDYSEEDSEIIEELKKLEEQNPDVKHSGFGFLSDKDFDDDNLDDEFVTGYEKGVNGGDDAEKPTSDDSYEDENDLESLWEHQELIEQLKMELKKVRATGLPTILEDSESPKLMDDLKPWKIDEFQRGDCLSELNKFYRSYRERMRKFDIINYQKMYAMGFLQLKDPLKSISTQKTSLPTLKSLVSHNVRLSKNKIHGTDPMKKLIKELQGDLEAVYVAQMCLSWEFLHWQYDKALAIWDSDSRASRRYNEVAGEFQQFQVLMQRFIEDEPFQGQRVQNYVKTRCAVRNLLQVPVIREDNIKDKRKARAAKASNEYVITSEMLVETVEESIRIFWRFVRADKDCSINGHKKLPELPDPDQDLELLMEIKKNLQKKERKLKDILRSENCILRKFRRCREDDLDDQVLYFFSQVDMKLVCRVLNMSKITGDQLIWCRNKLDRISFVHRRIHVEPAFLLYPC